MQSGAVGEAVRAAGVVGGALTSRGERILALHAALVKVADAVGGDREGPWRTAGTSATALAGDAGARFRRASVAKAGSRGELIRPGELDAITGSSGICPAVPRI
jgi:hypothetical protein